MADQLLDHARDALNQEGVGGEPDHSYVSHGEPAVDCEQLTVHLGDLSPRATVTGSERCAIVPLARFCIQLWRCVTAVDGNGPPSAEVLDAEARALLIDAAALWKHLTRQWREGTLLDGVSCREVTWSGLTPLPPQGGLAGWELCLTVQV